MRFLLGKVPGPGRPTNMDYRRAGAYSLEKVREGVVLTFFLSSIISLLFSFSLSLGSDLI